eukprot:1104865-Prymnesium_polylepis.1
MLDRERDHVLPIIGLHRDVPAEARCLGPRRAQRLAATVLRLHADAVEVLRRHLGAHRGRLHFAGLGVHHGHDLLLGLLFSQHDL